MSNIVVLNKYVIVQVDKHRCEFNFNAISAIQAWVHDSLTYDTIMITIEYDHETITICEDVIGFDRFLLYVEQNLPIDNPNWRKELLEKPFNEKQVLVYRKPENDI
jgi:hypothetical protein